jgi:hypothetical protein
MFDQVIPRLTRAQEAFVGDVIIVSDVDETTCAEDVALLRLTQGANVPYEDALTTGFNGSNAVTGRILRLPLQHGQDCPAFWSTYDIPKVH